MTLLTDKKAWFTPSNNPEQKRYETFDDVWHYTNAAGLEGILRSDTLWASSHLSLNDTSEIEFGIRAVESAWAQFLPELVPEAPIEAVGLWLDEMATKARDRAFYFISATGDGDSLVHWRAYAGEHGYAIRFDPSSEFRLLRPTDESDLFQPDFIPSMYWRSVQYGEFELRWTQRRDNRIYSMVERALDAFSALKQGRVSDVRALNDSLEQFYLTTVAFVKHAAFEHEQEVRLLAIAPPFPELVATREGRYGAQTYLTLSAAGDEILRYSTSETRQLAITQVRVGPGAGTPKFESWVANLLSDAGYKDVLVDRSELPFR